MSSSHHSYDELTNELASRLAEVERALSAWGARSGEVHIAQCVAALRSGRLALATCDAQPSMLLRALDELHRAHAALLINAAGVAYRLHPGRGAPATKARDARRTPVSRVSPVIADFAHAVSSADADEADWEILSAP